MGWLSELLTKDLERKLDHVLGVINSNHTQLMSIISDFAAKQQAFNDRQGAAIDGLVADVKALSDKIDELQNSPDRITPADQALLDDIEKKADAVTARLEALDQQTPPVVPNPPPTP